LTLSSIHGCELNISLQEEEKKGGKKGRLLGVITLSDVLRYIVGKVDLGESIDTPSTANSENQTPAPGSPL